ETADAWLARISMLRSLHSSLSLRIEYRSQRCEGAMQVMSDNVHRLAQPLCNLFRSQPFVIRQLENCALARLQSLQHLFSQASDFWWLTRQRAVQSKIQC